MRQETASQSGEMYQKARKVLAGGISHELRYQTPHPIYFSKAAGPYTWDVDGRKYIDYNMGSASMLLGHAHPAIVEAIAKQAYDGTFYGNSHPKEIEWGELIQSMYPSAERVRFTGSGSEATMLAIRLARAATGKEQIIRFEGHYHGWHDYVARGSSIPFDRPDSAGVLAGAQMATIVCPLETKMVERVLIENKDVAGIICEASGASYGTVPLPKNFLQELRTLSTKYSVVLIFDEVITGFRWSPGGVQALIGVTPDLTTLAKILTGGMPGGAVAGRETFMRLLDPEFETEGRKPYVSHKGTFNGAPIVAAPAVAALKILQTGEPQRAADAVATSLRKGMQDILDHHQVAGAIFGDSSTFHIYFGKRDISGLSGAELKGVPKSVVAAFRRTVKQRGLDLMSYLGGVTSSAHTQADIEQTLDIFRDTIQDLIAQRVLTAF